ncbi:averantin oxidoreductase [Stagonosporopsis vannaccii]|nr:averantin oxidoreductase [Stagonosporopsis vannaccii]
MSILQSKSDGILTKKMLAVSMTRILVVAIVLVLGTALIKGIYRIYFHPLRNFPGPKLRVASRIPWHYATLTGSRNKLLSALHAQYGHIVRVNPDELSFTDPDSWKDIYGHGTKANPGETPQKDWKKYGRSVNHAYSLIQAPPKDHARMRKIFAPAFSDRALKQQEPLFVRYADLLIAKCREGMETDPGKKWDLVRMYNFTTFDIMGDLTFGESLHMLDRTDYDPWVSAIFDSIVMITCLSAMMDYPWLFSAFKWLMPSSVNKKQLEHFQHSVTRVTKRLDKGRNADGVDLWDLVLSQKEGKGLSRDEMDANSSLFMMAGTETTATLLSGLTYQLLKTPESMEKLVKEIRDQFASAEEMTMERLAALPYLNACIKEAFRVYPPSPLTPPRVAPGQGSTVVGQFIPPGSVLSIPQYVMNTHEKNFKKPLDYIPERWLGNQEFESDQRHAVQPFSVGPMDCVGKK